MPTTSKHGQMGQNSLKQETLSPPCFLRHAWPIRCASLQVQHGTQRHPGRSQDDRRLSGASVAPPPEGPTGIRCHLPSGPPAGSAAPCRPPKPGSAPAVHTRQKHPLLTQPLICTVLSLTPLLSFKRPSLPHSKVLVVFSFVPPSVQMCQYKCDILYEFEQYE